MLAGKSNGCYRNGWDGADDRNRKPSVERQRPPSPHQLNRRLTHAKVALIVLLQRFDGIEWVKNRLRARRGQAGGKAVLQCHQHVLLRGRDLRDMLPAR